jgi:hypothetical protein
VCGGRSWLPRVAGLWFGVAGWARRGASLSRARALAACVTARRVLRAETVGLPLGLGARIPSRGIGSGSARRKGRDGAATARRLRPGTRIRETAYGRRDGGVTPRSRREEAVSRHRLRLPRRRGCDGSASPRRLRPGTRIHETASGRRDSGVTPRSRREEAVSRPKGRRGRGGRRATDAVDAERLTRPAQRRTRPSAATPPKKHDRRGCGGRCIRNRAVTGSGGARRSGLHSPGVSARMS